MNTRRGNSAGAVIHGYNREKDRVAMFRDDDDRRYFKGLFARYLAVETQKDARGRSYPNHRSNVKLVALAAMTNHYHVGLLEAVSGAAGELMHAVLTSYVVHFNKRHGRTGEMFDGEVRLRPAENRRDELNIISYVHENHADHCYCEFCSHSLYVGHPAHVPEWIDVSAGLSRFGGVAGYQRWLLARQIQREVLGGS